MVKRLIILLLVLANSFCINAQYITAGYHAGEGLGIQQLWDVSIHLPVINGKFYYLTFNLTDKNGAVLLEAKSKTFKITESTYHFSDNITANSPYEYNYLNQEWRRSCEKTGNIIPAGNYMVNYVLYETTQGCNWTGIVSFQITIPLNIQYYNSLDLVFPYDNDTIYDSYPLLKWLQLIPEVSDVEYLLTITELLAGQNKELSMVYNPFLYNEKTINTDISYPLFARKLEKGKSYSWQVKAIKDNRIVTESEIWVFTIGSNQQDTIIEENPDVFLTLNPEPIPSHWVNIKGDYLYFTVKTEFDVNRNVNYAIYSSSSENSIVISGKKSPLTIEYGKNLYSLSVADLKNNGKYSLHVKTDAGTQYLNFIKINK